MKLKVLITKTRVPVYRSSLWVVISNSVINAIDHVEDQVNIKIHSDEHRNSTKAYAFGQVDESGKKQFMLFLKPNCQPGELAHEVKHIVNMIFNWHGVKLSVTNDESECYFLERITNKVYHTINQYKKLYKPKKNGITMDPVHTCRCNSQLVLDRKEEVSA